MLPVKRYYRNGNLEIGLFSVRLDGCQLNAFCRCQAVVRSSSENGSELPRFVRELHGNG